MPVMRLQDISRLPLAKSLPLMLLLAFSIYGLLSAVYTYQQKRSEFIEQVDRRLRQEAARFTRIAKRETANNPGLVAQEVMLLGTDPDLRLSALIDARGMVVAAQDPDWIEKPIGELWPNWKNDWLFKQGEAFMIERQDKGKTLVLIQSVLVPPNGNPTISEKMASRSRGVVLVAYNLVPGFEAALLNAVIQCLFDFAIGISLVLMASLWLQNRVGQPVARLAAAARRIGEGEFSTPIDVSGSGELENLASDLQAMANALRHGSIELNKLSQAVEQSPASIVITDLQGAIEYVN